MSAISKTLQTLAGDTPDGESVMVNVSRLRDAASEIERLREAAQLAIKLIDANLYHQREKVQDAASLLRQALDPI